MAEARRIVSFELSAVELMALKDEVERGDVRSHHQRAKEIVTRYLANPQTRELRDYIAILDADVAYLTELTRRAVYSNLVHIGGRDSKDANDWIREHMPVKSKR